MSSSISQLPAQKPWFQQGVLDTGDGHQLYWSDFGPPDRTPLLMVHGGHGYIFEMTRFSVPENYRLILLHQRGIGRSEPLGKLENNTLDQNVLDMERLRLHLGIEKWDIFSWSFGAVYMLDYAAAYPERCGKLISYAPYLATEQDWDVIQDKSFFAHHGAKTALEYTKNAFENLASATPEAWRQSLYNAYKAGGGAKLFEEYTAERTPEQWDRKFKESMVGALHEKQALHDLSPLWLAERTAASPLFSSLQIILAYGDADPWVAPNPAIDSICPKAQVIKIPGGKHDVHDPVVQKYLEAIFHNLNNGSYAPSAENLKVNFQK